MDIQEILQYAVAQGASDVHLSSSAPPVLRVDGDLVKFNTEALSSHSVQKMVCSLMTDQQVQQFHNGSEIDFSFSMPDIARFRANIFSQRHGPAAAFRIIANQVTSLAALDAPPIFKQIAELRHGLVLVTGPTGSGKSSTLAALVDYINHSFPLHIVTIEDPIEFVHEHKLALVSQREVKQHTKSFSTALRAALREDPDVLLVGELRDLETIRLALTAAETGHLVFATLHTSSAAKSIDRIVDVFPGEEKDLVRTMLSESLRAVIAQVLVKKRGGGRVAAHEIMIVNHAIKNLIREGKVSQIYSALQTGSALGMQTMEQAIKKLQDAGHLCASSSAREQV